MSTATLPQTFTQTPKEAHDENVAFATANNLPYVSITGNTYPIKNVLFSMGGKWNRDLKMQQVPQHRAVEAQTLADRFAPKAKVATPVAKVAAPVKAKVETTPAHNSGGNLINRADVIQRMISRLQADVETVRGEDPTLKQALVSLRAAHILTINALNNLKGE